MLIDEFPNINQILNFEMYLLKERMFLVIEIGKRRKEWRVSPYLIQIKKDPGFYFTLKTGVLLIVYYPIPIIIDIPEA